MKIAISNIAWFPEEDRDALAMLRECGLSAIEVAPSRWWPDPANATAAQAREHAERLRADGFSVAGFQAILFGKPDLTIFDSTDQRRACLDYLTHIAQLLAICGGGAIVFGAPKNRLVPAAMTSTEADRIAVEFFVELAGRAARLGAWYCLEPNPTGYGCNYVTHVADAARIVRQVNSPGLRMQIDAGELAMNNEAVDRIVGEHHDIIGHVHISQPMLGSFEAPWAGHSALAAALARAGYAGFASVEMKRPAEGLKGVRAAVEFARQCYGTT